MSKARVLLSLAPCRKPKPPSPHHHQPPTPLAPQTEDLSTAAKRERRSRQRRRDGQGVGGLFEMDMLARCLGEVLCGDGGSGRARLEELARHKGDEGSTDMDRSVSEWLGLGSMEGWMSSPVDVGVCVLTGCVVGSRCGRSCSTLRRGSGRPRRSLHPKQRKTKKTSVRSCGRTLTKHWTAPDINDGPVSVCVCVCVCVLGQTMRVWSTASSAAYRPSCSCSRLHHHTTLTNKQSVPTPLDHCTHTHTHTHTHVCQHAPFLSLCVFRRGRRSEPSA